MRLYRWAVSMPLCAALLVGSACGDEEEDDADSAQDAGVVDASEGTSSGDDASTSDGGALDASTSEDAASASDASTADATAKDGGGSVPVAGEFPVLPVDGKNMIIINVTGGKATRLADGTYQAPYQKGASQGSSVSFLDSSYIFTMMPSLQVQITMKREKKDGSFTCERLTQVIVRYGKPPSGNNQLVARSCNVEYTYDAATLTYTGTIKAKISDGLLEAEEPESDMLGRFTWTES